MLRVKNLYFRHRGTGIDILRDISFEAREGEMTTLLGPNGSGKTTLFKCIAGIWKISKGDILFGEKSIKNYNYRERAKIISVVPQEHQPVFPYTVFELVLMGRVSRVGLFSVPSKRDEKIAEEALSLLGIEHLRDRDYTRISGGERQLALIARALAQQTPLLLLDEPTSHLDFKNQITLLKKIKELAREKNLTVVMTLHDPNLAMIFSDRIVLLTKGSILCTGSPKEVLNPANLHNVYEIEVSILSNTDKCYIYPII